MNKTDYHREYKRKWRLKHPNYDYNLKHKENGNFVPKTDWKYTKPVCRFCGKDDGNLFKSCKNKNNRVYLTCNTCNTERCKKYRSENKKNIIKIVKKFEKNNQDKVMAWRILNNAIKSKTITKSPCYCGNIKVDGHHNDYSKPLEVIWLCRLHHKLYHNTCNNL